ncbi:MAG: hypothetical protein ACRDRN_08655 [Sciscionella sp.]
MTHRGIALDSWAMVDGECPITCEVIGDQAQFLLGHSVGSLNLIASETGLAALVGVATEALRRWQAIPHGEKVLFTVPPSAT